MMVLASILLHGVCCGLLLELFGGYLKISRERVIFMLSVISLLLAPKFFFSSSIFLKFHCSTFLHFVFHF